MYHPCIPHWQAIKKILRYLNHTKNLGLHFFAQSSFNLSTYANADWAKNLDNQIFTGGFYIYFSSHLLSSSFKKQLTVTRSYTKAAYKALVNTTCELLWLQSLFNEFVVSLIDPPRL